MTSKSKVLVSIVKHFFPAHCLLYISFQSLGVGGPSVYAGSEVHMTSKSKVYD